MTVSKPILSDLRLSIRQKVNNERLPIGMKKYLHLLAICAQSVSYEDIQGRLLAGEFEQMDLTDYQLRQNVGPVVPVEVVDRLSKQWVHHLKV